jgi:hypothetical protein
VAAMLIAGYDTSKTINLRAEALPEFEACPEE